MNGIYYKEKKKRGILIKKKRGKGRVIGFVPHRYLEKIN
jgi:hypothetical protein